MGIGPPKACARCRPGLGFLVLTGVADCRPARIVNVSSSAHSFGRINFDDLQSRKSYQPWIAYGQ